MTTNAQVVQLFTDVLTRWNEREAEFRDWQAGTAEGGPNADGRYPLTNGSNETFLVACPAKLADTVAGPAVLSQAAQVAAEAAQSASETASTQSNNSRLLSENFKNAALAARDLALLYRDQCAAAQAAVASFQAIVIAKHDTVVTKAAQVEVLHGETLEARDDTLVARAEAMVARDQAEDFAASINPAILATKAELQSELDALIDAAPGTLDTLNEIAAALGDDPNFATTITNSVAGKAPLVHSHVISDVTGLDTALANKQPVGSYAGSVHGHVISDVTGLQTELDGKQVAGSYAASVHGHVISDVTGLQTALDGKQASGSYAAASHVHTIANVTGLQTALDGKQASGSYSLTGHTHVIADVTGLQTALDGKQASGSYVTTANFTWTNLSGKPTTFTPSAHSHVISDVTGLQAALDGKQAALGFTPYNATNPAGYISGITSGNVTTALGYTPVQQGGGAGQGSSKIYVGWLGSALGLQVDATNFSATWPISISGNAATVGSITGGQVTTALGYTPVNKAGDTFTGAVSIPDLTVSDNTPTFSSSLFQYHYHQSPHIAYVKKSGGFSWYWRRNDTGLGGGANEIEDMSLSEGGELQARGSLRAPVFYDSENTAYLVNPAGDTNLYRTFTYLGGRDANSNWNTGFQNTPPASYNFHGDLNGGTNTPASGWWFYESMRHSNPTNFWGTQVAWGWEDNATRLMQRNVGNGTFFGWVEYLNTSGRTYNGNLNMTGSIISTSSDMRAPIFYDTNNTGYFVDPTGSTSLRTVGDWRSDSGAWTGEFPGKIQYHINSWYFQASSSWVFRDSAGGEPFRVTQAGLAEARQEFRAPIFYDSNDTSTFINPNGESWIKGSVALSRVSPAGDNDCFGGLELREVSLVGNTQTAATYAPRVNFHWGNIAAATIYMASSGNFVFGGQSDITNNRRSIFCNELYATGNVTAYFSDDRLKTRIGNIKNALDIVSSLNGFRYVDNDLAKTFGYANDGIQIGVSAQEVQKHLPEIVRGAAFDVNIDDPDHGSKSGEDYLTVDYSRLVPVLIEAIKELKAEIETLKAKG